MSATIDERVVEMRFDNSNFEKNAQETMSTLEKLKKALKFENAAESLKTIERASKDVSFDAMSQSIDALNNKFSTMGIAWMTTVQRVTNSVLDGAKRIFTAIPNQIKSGGWQRAMNVEQAKFTLKGLQIAWEDVADDIDHAVLGTAYGADQAAKAASSLAASGVAYGGLIKTLDDGTEIWSDMGRALRGISGVAAMTNSEYSDIAAIFTAVAGNGKIMTKQLQQLSFRGLNVAAKLAEYFNQVNEGSVYVSDNVKSAIQEITGGAKVSEAAIRDFVTDGVISFDIFSEAMDTAFGKHATNANETFSGAMSNMKAALSRIGQDFAQTILQQTPQVFNSIKDLFNRIKTYTKPFADYIFTPYFTRAMQEASFIINRFTKSIPKWNGFNDATGRSLKIFTAMQDIGRGFRNTFYSILLVMLPIKDAFKETFNTPILTRISSFAKAFKDFSYRLIISEETAENLKNIFKGVFSVLKLGVKIITSLLRVISPILRLIIPIASFLTKIVSAIGEFITVVANAVAGGSAFNNMFDVMYNAMDTLANVITVVLKLLGDLASSFIITAGTKFASWIGDLVTKFKDWAKRINLVNKVLIVLAIVLVSPIALVGALAYAIYKLVVRISQLEIIQKIANTISVAFAVVKTVVSNVINTIVTAVNNLVRVFKSFNIAQYIDKIKTKLSDIKKTITGFFTELTRDGRIVDIIRERFAGLFETITKLKDEFKSVIIGDMTGDLDSAGESANRFKTVIGQLQNALKIFFNSIDLNKVVVLVFTATMIHMMNTFTTLGKSLTGVFSGIKGVTTAIQNFIKGFTRKADSKIIDFARAILILSAALFIIGKIPADRLKASVKAIGVLIGILTAFSVVVGIFGVIMAKMKNGEKMAASVKTMTAVFIGLSGAFAVIAIALRILNTVKVDANLLGTTAIIIGILAALGVISALLVKATSNKGALKSVFTMLSFSVAMLSMGRALDRLSHIDFNNIKDHVLDIVLLMGALSLVAVTSSKMGIFNALGLLLIATTLDKIMPQLEELITSIDINAIMETLRKYEPLIKELGIIAIAMGVVAALSGKGVKNFGVGVLFMSASFILLAKGIKSLAAIGATEVARGMKVVKKVFLLFALLALVTTFGGAHAMQIGGAIAVMTLSLYAISGAVWILGTMNPTKVTYGVRAIQGLLAAMALVVAAASIGNGKTGFATVLSMVFGITAIIAELIVLSLVPIGQVAGVVIAMDSVMIALAVLFKSLTTIGDKQMPKGTLRAMLIMIPLLGAIGTALFIVGRNNWGHNFGTAIAVSATIRAIGNLLTTLNGLETIDYGVIQALNRMILVIAAVGLTIGGVGALTSVTGGNGFRLIATAMAIDMVLKTLAKVMTTVSKVGANDVSLKGIEALNNMYKILIAAGLTIAGVAAITSLTGGNGLRLITTATAIDMVLKTLAKVVKTMGNIKGTIDYSAIQTIEMLRNVVISIGLVLGGLAAVNNLTGGHAAGFVLIALAIDMILAVMGSMVKKFSKLTKGVDTSILSTLKVLCAVIVAIGASLAIAGIQPWHKILVAMLAINLTMVVLATVVKSISQLQGGAKTWLNVLAMIVVLGGIVGALAILANVPNIEKVIDNVKELSILIGVVTAAVAVAGALGVASLVGSIAAVGGLIIFVGGIAAVLNEVANIFGEIDNDYKEKILTGFDNLSVIGVKIAEGIGNFIGSLASSLSQHLPSIGKALSDFATSLGPFIDNIKKVNFDVVRGSFWMAIALGVLSGGEFIMGLVENFTGTNMGKIGDNLATFAEGVAKFGTTILGIGAEDFSIVASSAKSLAEVIAILAADKVLTALTSPLIGEKDNDISTNLVNFGEAMVAFAGSTEGLTPDAVSGAVAAGEALAGLLNALPRHGGLWQDLIGDNTLDYFTPKTLGRNGLGGGIKQFVNQTKAIKPNAADGAIDVANKLFMLDPPREGGFLQEIIGHNGDYGVFDQEMLGKFALGIRAFAWAAQGTGKNSADGAIDVASKIFALDPPREDGALQKIVGQNSYDDLGEKLPKFGKGIADFAAAVGELSLDDATHVGYMIGIIDALFNSNAHEQLNDIMMSQVFTDAMGPIQMDNMTTIFKLLGDSFRSLQESFDGVSYSIVNGILLNIKNFGEAFATIDYEALNKNLKKVKDMDSESLGSFGIAIRSFVWTVQGVGLNSADGAFDVASKLFALDAPKTSGFFEKVLKGTTDYGDLATQLTAFGKGLLDMVSYTSHINESHLGTVGVAIGLVDALYESDIGTELKDILLDGAFTDIVYVDSIKNMKQTFINLGAMCKSIVESFSGIFMDRVKQIISGVAELPALFSSLQSFDSGKFKEFEDAMSNAGDFGISKFLETFSEIDTTKVSDSIKTFFDAVATAMLENGEVLNTPGDTVLTNLSKFLTNNQVHKVEFNDVGKLLDTYLAEGITASVDVVTDSAKAVVSAAADAAVEEAASRSGDLFDAGKDMFDPSDNDFQGGIESTEPAVSESAQNVVASAANSAISMAKSKGGSLWQAGANMISQFYAGIKSQYGSIGEAMKAAWKGDVNISDVLGSGYGGAYTAFTEMSKAAKQNGESVFETRTGIDLLDKALDAVVPDIDSTTDALDDLDDNLKKTGGSAEKAADKIKDFHDSLLSSLESKTGGMSFFNKLELKAETSAKTILENMKSNVDGVASWTARLQKVMEKGLDKGLVKTLAEAGLDSYDQVTAFMNMTDEEIQQANDLFQQAAAGRAYAANEITNDYITLGKDNMRGYAKGMAEGFDEANEQSMQNITGIHENAEGEEGHASPSEWWRILGLDNMRGYYFGFYEGSNIVYREAVRIVELIHKVFEEGFSKDTMVGIGKTVGEGLAKGMDDSLNTVRASALALAKEVETATKSQKGLDVNSPSKKAILIGKSFDEGLAKGITNNSGMVKGASIDVARSVLDPVSDAMSNSYFGKSLDVNPTITPTLDLSYLQASIASISDMFNEREAIDLNAKVNDWSNPAVRNNYLNDMANRIGTEYADKVVRAINDKDSSTQVYLEGDAKGVFKLVRKENRRFIQRTGYSGI